MTPNALLVSDAVDDDVARTIEGGLRRFNERHAGPDATKALWVVRRDEGGEIIGGLLAQTMWDWCSIAVLWVREDRRGQGLGGEILMKAEQAAIERGCSKFQLVTMSFQAPRFYERLGYSEIGRVEEFPPGHTYIWMSKIIRA